MAQDQATICFVGDLVGSCGRRTLLTLLPSIRERFEPTFEAALKVPPNLKMESQLR